MKKHVMNIFLAMILITLLAASASAATIKTHEVVNLSKDIKDDVYIAAGDVKVESKIYGDLVVAGGNIKVLGDITQDLIAAGGDITVENIIGDDARIAGGNIKIDSQINGDLVVAGGNIELVKGTVINKDLVIAGGNIVIGANVNGDAKIGGGDVTINGPIAGDVLIDVDKLEFGKNGVIRGDLQYIGKKPSFDESKVEGSITQSSIAPRDFKKPKDAVASRVFFFLILFVTGVFFLWLGRRFTDNTIKNIMQRSSTSLIAGVLTLILAPIIGLLLLFSVIGFPIGLFTLILYGFGIFFSLMFASMVTGRLIFRKGEMNVYVSLFLGAIIFVLLTWIPVIGGIIVFAAILFGLGGMTIAMFGHMVKKKRKRKPKKKVRLNKVR